MRLTLGIALLAYCCAAAAGEPVKLQGMKLSGGSASGTCGAAKVTVEGLGADYIEFAGRIEVESGQGRLVLSGKDDSFFQDWNYLECVETANGPMLVAKASCGGRACNSDDFRVIDPRTAMVVSQGTPDEGCSYQCAEKALGEQLPEGIRPAYAE